MIQSVHAEMSSSIIIEPEANAFVDDSFGIHGAYYKHMAIYTTSENGSRPYIMEVGQMKEKVGGHSTRLAVFAAHTRPSTLISYLRFNLTGLTTPALDLIN